MPTRRFGDFVGAGLLVAAMFLPFVALPFQPIMGIETWEGRAYVGIAVILASVAWRLPRFVGVAHVLVFLVVMQTWAASPTVGNLRIGSEVVVPYIVCPWLLGYGIFVSFRAIARLEELSMAQQSSALARLALGIGPILLILPAVLPWKTGSVEAPNLPTFLGFELWEGRVLVVAAFVLMIVALRFPHYAVPTHLVAFATVWYLVWLPFALGIGHAWDYLIGAYLVFWVTPFWLILFGLVGMVGHATVSAHLDGGQHEGIGSRAL